VSGAALLLVALLGAPGGTARPVPPAAEVLLARARLAEQTTGVEAAVVLLEQAAEAAPDCPRVHRALGRALHAAGRLPEATAALRRAAALAPDDPAVQADLGMLYMARGNWWFAVRALRAAHAGLPERADVAYALAACLARAGGHEDAVEGLERAAAGDGEVARRARYDLGVAHHALGRPYAARRHFADALASGVPPGPVEEYLDATWRAEHGRQPAASVTSVLSAEYDSNPTFRPDVDPAPPGPGAGVSTYRGVALAAFTLRPWWRPRGGLAVTGSFRLGESTSEEADDLDSTEVRAGLGWTRRLVAWGLDQELTVDYRFGLVGLRGGPLTAPDLEPFVFSESHGGVVSWRVWQRERAWTTASYSLVRTGYRPEGRTGVGHLAALRHTALLAGGRRRVDAQLSARVWDAEGDWYDLRGLGGFLGGSGLLAFGVQAFGGLSFELRDHPHSEGVWDAYPQRREDLGRGVQAGLARRLGDRLQTSLQWSWTRQDSTVRLYRPERHVVGLLLAGAL